MARPEGLRRVTVISRTSVPATRVAIRRASSLPETRRTHSVQEDSRSKLGPATSASVQTASTRLPLFHQRSRSPARSVKDEDGKYRSPTRRASGSSGSTARPTPPPAVFAQFLAPPPPRKPPTAPTPPDSRRAGEKSSPPYPSPARI